MIYNLCNIGNEQNATFNKASIIKKSSLPAFNHLATDTQIQDYITNLAESSDVINFELLPENLSISQTTRAGENDVLYNVSSSMIVTPLDKNLEQLLELYNNQEVVLLLEQPGASYLYGTTTSPLVLTYDEQHSNQPQGLKGYTLSMRGICLGTSKKFENITLNIFNRGLAFELAGSL